MAIEQATHDNRGGRNARLRCIAHREDHTVLACSLGREYCCGMNEDGRTYLFTGLPEWLQLWIIKVLALNVCPYLNPSEAEPGYSATNFGCR